MATNKTCEFFIQWHLTERCNLRCKHCYQTERNIEEMHLSEINEVISEVSEMLNAWSENYDIYFSTSFNVTGGEPFLHQDIFKILEEIKRKEFDIYILSNGTLINRERAKRLLDLAVKGVQVSIEGPENVHESIRGKGSFYSSLEGIQNLLEAGIKVTLNVTLSEINADYFMDIVALSSSLGVHRLGFSRLVPSGRGKRLFNKMISKERAKEIYEKMYSLNINGLEITTGDPVASQMTIHSNENDSGSVPKGGCAAGISGLTLLPDGTIMPCRRLNVPIGNVRKDSLREVWVSSEVLQQLRDKEIYKGKCGICRRWATCRGCRAIAYAHSGDLLTEDPQCFITEI